MGTEVVSRTLVDPIYFYSIDPYNLRDASGSSQNKFSYIFSKKKIAQVDFLFIGSSRVAATINPRIFTQQNASHVTVVAGRGHTSSGIHYQALKNRLSEHPNYLRGAKVFIEYSGSSQYDEPFRGEQFRVDQKMPHLLLPYLDYQSLFEYVDKSPNSRQTKLNMIALFLSASYRSVPFVRENLQKLDVPVFNQSEQLIASDGGIRNDQTAMARAQAVASAKQKIEDSKNNPIITQKDLNQSTLAHLHELITQNGGQLFLYKMPLHSIQKQVYTSEKEISNQQIFEEWLCSKDIEIIYNQRFKYTDADFPDIWHLSQDKRDEFSALLYEDIKANLN
ncbi:MAG: hypothetical protein AAFW84_09515 [Cyanobacteria bacterium J06635_15]